MFRSFAFGSALVLASSAGLAGPFTPGNLAVVRIGDGVTPLSTDAAPVFILEFTRGGALVQTIPLPSTTTGGRALTVRGSSTSTGHLSRSLDQRYLVLAGFDASAGTPSVSNSLSGEVNRVVARIDRLGRIDLSTALQDAYNSDDTRSVATVDGSAFWLAGPSGSPASSGGVRYALFGASTSVQLSAAPTNTRIVNIFNNQLYIASASQTFQGVSAVGSGLPTTGGQTTTLLNGFPTTSGPSSYDFFFADAGTLYVADDRISVSGGGIEKWTFDGSAWSRAYTITGSAGTGCRGLTGEVTPGGNLLFATTADNRLVTALDTGASTMFVEIAAAPSGAAFRGVDFTPPTPCFANCDGSTAQPFLNVADFVCFQQTFAAGNSAANCDNSTSPPILNVADFVCFQQSFAAGCSAP
jgi:hypothetical protein